MNKISGINKVERYDWVKPGDQGRQCSLPVDELKIDHSYQRQEVSGSNTLAIARALNWNAFNTITVMERENGDKYVVDGQQRLLAVRRRGDISQVPCMLFKSEGRDHEARAFIALNVRRRHVSAFAKFQAGVSAGCDPEKQIADWLSSQGLKVTEHSKARNGVDFPSELIRSWNLNTNACKRAITIQQDVNGTDPMNSICHKGIFWLLHNGIKVEEHADKLKLLGGRSAILRSVKTLEIETGAKASERGCGIGVLRLINHKRRRKIAIAEVE